MICVRIVSGEIFTYEHAAGVRVERDDNLLVIEGMEEPAVQAQRVRTRGRAPYLAVFNMDQVVAWSREPRALVVGG